MSELLLPIIASIILLFLIMLFFIFIRRRVVVESQGKHLLLKYPIQKRKIDLGQELEGWEVEKTYYLRWGIFYSIKMRLKGGKYITVDSLFHQQKFDRLYAYLKRKHSEKRKEGI